MIDALYKGEVSPRSQCEGSESFPLDVPEAGSPGHRNTVRTNGLPGSATWQHNIKYADVNTSCSPRTFHTYIDLTIYELAKCSSVFQALP